MECGFFNAIPEDLVSDNIDLSNITWLRRDSKFHCYGRSIHFKCI